MAQKLDANLNVISETPIDIQMIGGDLNIISALDDEPNDVGGLTSAELKAKFDEAGLIIQKYINEQLIPAIIASDATETARASAEAERVANEVERVNNENIRESNESTRKYAETSRVSNEEQRIENERKREDAETGYVAQAKKYAEAAEESAQNAIASGVFMGGKYTTLEEYYTAYYTEKRPCFMRRSFGLDGETPATTFWVLDDVLAGENVTEESKYAKFYRIHEDGTVLYGKLTSDGTFTVTEGKTDTFVGDDATTAQEYYEAYAAGKVCFMRRTLGGSGITTWVMSSVNRTTNAGAGYVYTAYFYRITADGKIIWGVLSPYGNFTYEEASGGGESNVFVGDDTTTAQEFYDAHTAGKACFMMRPASGGGYIQWIMYYGSSSPAGYFAYFYSVDYNGKLQYGELSSSGEFTYDEVDVAGKADASTTTKAGTYGSALSSGGFYFPVFTVNEQGIVTGASESLIPMASTKSSGLMGYLMHSYVSQNGHLEIAYMSRDESYADTEIDLAVPNCKMKNPYVGGTARYMPSVYGVYAYNADDDSFVPVPIIKTKGTSGGTGTVYVNFDSAYLDSSGSATFVVLYERSYSTYGSSM